ncbi:MAG: peroxiredoxin family protein, partial [Muribaculaceae bacterium]
VPVFSPAEKNDVRIIGAVANAYNAFKPNDPRTKLLVATFLSNRQIDVPAAGLDTIVATETKILDIELPDRNGNIQKLSDVTSKGNVVVLSFTAYSLENSPAYNKLLSDIYTKYSSRGFQIYQVGLDSDVAQWKLSANNLPWITVYDEAGTNSNNVIKYNVGAVPMSYVIDRSGEIQSRVIDQTQLDSEVAKLL